MAQEDNGFKPPYLPFRTFTNFLEDLEARQGQWPPRIDRSYLRNMSGVTQSQLLAALRAFALIDEEGKIKPLLKDLATKPDERPRLIGELVRKHYPEMVELGEKNATQKMLEDAFAEYELSGSTRRKAISFFLKAAEWGDVKVSPHFSVPRTASSGGNARRRRAAKSKEPVLDQPRTETQTRTQDAKDRYIELLLKKAEEEMDDELLDRIERVIGVQSPQRTPSKTESD